MKKRSEGGRMVPMGKAMQRRVLRIALSACILCLGLQLSCFGTSLLASAEEMDLALSSGEMAELHFETIYFPYDSSRITASAEKSIKKNVALLKKNRELRILVIGHVDGKGVPSEYAMSLGERHAMAVVRRLVQLEISVDRIDSMSFGKERPAALGHDEAARAKNDRVEFMVAPSKAATSKQ